MKARIISLFSLTTLLVATLFASDADTAVYNMLSRPDENFYSDTAQLSRLYRAEAMIPQMTDDSLKSKVYYYIGRFLTNRGDVSQAHDYLIKSIEYSDRYERNRQWSYKNRSECHYIMATSYLNQTDTAGMRRITVLMKETADAAPDNINVQYDYNSVMQAYYSLIFSFSENQTDIDLSMEYAKKAIFYQEQMTPVEWQENTINPVWAYYNVAVCYDLYYEPMPLDSIGKYLDLAETTLVRWHPIPIDSLESYISINDERAWLHYYKKEYDAAIKVMNGVLAMIERMEKLSPNTVVTERGEAYSFFVELYAETGDYETALEYQQRLEENNKKRFDIEKNRAIHEIEARYELAYHEQAVKSLKKENGIIRRVLIWTVVSAVLLLCVLSLVIIVIRQKKINLEQSLYEAALEADSRRENNDIGYLKYIEKLKTDFPNYCKEFDNVNGDYLQSVVQSAKSQLTAMDIKYLICFVAGLKPAQIAEMMNVEPASVYTVKYRLKKKLGKELFI